VKLGFIVLAHHYPEQLGRLVRQLAAPQARFFVHVDRGAARAVWAAMRNALADIERVTWLPRYYTHWGSFALVRAALAGLRAALAEGCDYALLLSGQDYPVQPVAALEAFLARSGGASFIHLRPLPDGDWPREGAGRIERWYFVWYGPGFRQRRKLERGVSKLLNWLRGPRRLPRGLTPYGGSQWWCLSARAAAEVVAFTRDNTRAAGFFRHVLIPDEAFFQTALWNSPVRDTLTGRNLTYLDWNGPPFPRVLGLEDFEALRASGCFFARKFDPALSGPLLDRIDAELL